MAALKAWFKANAAAFEDAGQQGDDSGGGDTANHQESGGGLEGAQEATAAFMPANQVTGTGAGAPTTRTLSLDHAGSDPAQDTTAGGATMAAQTTGSIAFDAPPTGSGSMEAALEALANVGDGTVTRDAADTTTGGGYTWSVTVSRSRSPPAT